MNNKSITLIWDLDGTLLDSYDVILDSIEEVSKKHHYPFDRDAVYKEVITYSVNHYLINLADKYRVSFDALKNECTAISRSNRLNIKAISHAVDTLRLLKEKGISNFVFTHRGVTTVEVLKNTGLYDYFIEIVSSLNGFNRKPDPSGINYLIDKYHLDKANTYYVGDRTIDIECACNAGIKSILYLPRDGVTIPTGKETYIVDDLIKIVNLF